MASGEERIARKRKKSHPWKGTASGPGVAVAPLLAVLALSLAIALPYPRPAVQPDPAPADTVAWAPPKPTDTLGRGMALSHALDARGLDVDQIRDVTRQLLAYRDPRTI